MTAELPQPVVESAAVQLARMEGKIDRVFDRVDDLRSHVANQDLRLGVHDEKIDGHDSRIQSLEEGAVADKETAVALALAIKEAKETNDAAAKAELDKENRKADKSWSPIQRLVLFAAGAMGVIQLYQALVPTR